MHIVAVNAPTNIQWIRIGCQIKQIVWHIGGLSSWWRHQLLNDLQQINEIRQFWVMFKLRVLDNSSTAFEKFYNIGKSGSSASFPFSKSLDIFASWPWKPGPSKVSAIPASPNFDCSWKQLKLATWIYNRVAPEGLPGVIIYFRSAAKQVIVSKLI